MVMNLLSNREKEVVYRARAGPRLHFQQHDTDGPGLHGYNFCESLMDALSHDTILSPTIGGDRFVELCRRAHVGPDIPAAGYRRPPFDFHW